MSENYNWHKDLTTKLVVLYQECSNLYDPNDPNYDDEEVRAATLDEIFTEMRQFDPLLTLAIVWSKIESFHNQMALVNEIGSLCARLYLFKSLLKPNVFENLTRVI